MLFYMNYNNKPKITITTINNKLTILMGSKYFHSRLSSWSIRSLGKVQRTHKLMNISMNVFAKNQMGEGIKSMMPLNQCQTVMWKGIQPPKNMVVAMAAITNIFKYSAR